MGEEGFQALQSSKEGCRESCTQNEIPEQICTQKSICSPQSCKQTRKCSTEEGSSCSTQSCNCSTQALQSSKEGCLESCTQKSICSPQSCNQTRKSSPQKSICSSTQKSSCSTQSSNCSTQKSARST